MPHYLPSKKLLFIIVSVFFAGGGLFWVVNIGKNGSGETPTDAGSVEVSGITASLLGEDTDNDGLKDWEESLWGTDSKNPDSDGDGTPDGEEVKSGRDPGQAGPGDKLDTPSSRMTGDKASAPAEPFSETQRMARELFSGVLSLNQSGNSSADTQDAFARSIAENIGGELPPDTYAIESVRLSSDNTDAALKRYGNEMGDILIRYGGGFTESEVDILILALETNDKKTLERLIPIVKAYEKTRDASLLVEVPPSVAFLHLDLLNDYQRLSETVDEMRVVLDDSLQGAVSLKSYVASVDHFTETMKELNNRFLARGIFFPATESGYLLTLIVQ